MINRTIFPAVAWSLIVVVYLLFPTTNSPLRRLSLAFRKSLCRRQECRFRTLWDKSEFFGSSPSFNPITGLDLLMYGECRERKKVLIIFEAGFKKWKLLRGFCREADRCVWLSGWFIELIKLGVLSFWWQFGDYMKGNVMCSRLFRFWKSAR